MKTIRTERKYEPTMAKHHANVLEAKRKEFTKPNLPEHRKETWVSPGAARYVVDCQSTKKGGVIGRCIQARSPRMICEEIQAENMSD